MLQRIGFVVTLLLLFVFALLFTALNDERFTLDFAFARAGVSAGLALVVAFCAGLLLGVLWRSTWVARLLAERGRLRHALRLAESRSTAGAPPADAV
jgi:uncharacterized integral membrane protein